MTRVTLRSGLWAATHAARRSLVADLSKLSDEHWRAQTLCAQWNVEEVVAHLTAAASVGPARWLASMEALVAVAEFYAGRDFTVPSRTVTSGLRLRATDSAFVAGDGPAVEGSTLALVMTMAGRRAYLDRLEGPGAGILSDRVA